MQLSPNYITIDVYTYIPPPHIYNHHLHIHIQLPPPQTTTTHYLPPAISATCVSAHHSPYKPSPHASCSDCCIVLCWSYLQAWSMVLVVVVSCCCCIPYKLALMLGPGATIPFAQVVVVTSCNLRWWCFFIQPLAQILHLHLGNLHCVVVVNDGGMYVVVSGGGDIIYIYKYSTCA